LNLYSRQRNGLTAADRDVAFLLATHGSLALASTHARTVADLHAAQLRRAIDSRDIIGQAKGILMNRRGISSDEAFDLLRRISQDMNIKIADLARTLADRHLDLDLPLPGG
jgi:AmiR/NasT family two-component response regulator